jgi:hypothetical protein
MLGFMVLYLPRVTVIVRRRLPFMLPPRIFCAHRVLFLLAALDGADIPLTGRFCNNALRACALVC